MVGTMGEGLQRMVVGKDKKSKHVNLDDGYQALQTEDPMAQHMAGVGNGGQSGNFNHLSQQEPYNPMATGDEVKCHKGYLCRNCPLLTYKWVSNPYNLL